QMRPLEGHPYLSLLLQAEGDVHWAVRYDDLHPADPPVHVFFRDWDHPTAFALSGHAPAAPSVSWFALEYLMNYTYGDGGGLGVALARPDETAGELATALPVRCRFEGMEAFEGDNILARIVRSWWSPDARLDVALWKRLPREAVPEAIWKHTHNGGSFS